MSDYEQIIYDKQGAIARVILNRARYRNAQSRLIREEMDEAFDRAVEDDEVRVIILSGAGDHFSSGHDLGTPPEKEDRARRPYAEGIGGEYKRSWDLNVANTLRWRDLPKPTIAEVQGFCIFGGWLIASAMDIIIASDDAKFLPSHLQYNSIPWDLGPRKAKEILFQSRFVNASEALELGFINQVVARDRLEAETMALAEKIAESDPFRLRMIKYSCNEMLDAMGFRTHIQAAHSNYMLLEVSGNVQPPEDEKAGKRRLPAVEQALRKDPALLGKKASEASSGGASGKTAAENGSPQAQGQTRTDGGAATVVAQENRLIVEHVLQPAILCRDLNKTMDFLQKAFGMYPSERVDIKNTGVNNAVYALGDMTFLELIEPYDPDCAAMRLLNRYGEGWHMLSVDLAEIDPAALDGRLHEIGVRTVRKEKPNPHVKAARHLHPKDTEGVLLLLALRSDRDDNGAWAGGAWREYVATNTRVVHSILGMSLATNDLEAAEIKYRALGFDFTDSFTDAGDEVLQATCPRGTFFQLRTPTSDDAPSAAAVRLRGSGLFHMALGVKDLEGARRSVEGAGGKIEREARIGDRRTFWTDPRTTLGAPLEFREIS